MESKAKSDMGQALKQLAAKKPFDKIAVSDITTVSGYNRQTFYYHFQDKYDLLNWVYYQDVFFDFVHDISFENWDTHLCRMLLKMREEKYFYENTIHYAKENFQDRFFHITNELFTEAVEVLDTKHNLNRQDVKFYASFFSYGACGVVSGWIGSGMKAEPKDFVKFMKGLVLSTEKAAYHKFTGI